MQDNLPIPFKFINYKKLYMLLYILKIKSNNQYIFQSAPIYTYQMQRCLGI